MVSHDVQVLPNGNLLFFRNFSLEDEESSLVEHDPVKNRAVWEYRPSTASDFQAAKRGSVQQLPNGFRLFAATVGNKSTATVIDRNDQVVWSLDLSPHTDVAMQGAYLWPVEAFLKNNRPLSR